MPEARDYLLELERLAREKSPDGRGRMLERMVDLFFATADQQNEADSVVFGSIMEQVAFEVEVEVRAQMAERFSTADNAPRNLLCSLAQDEITVARPVLERSPVLSDGDLISIARSHGQDHLLAISRRSALSALVTDVIVERGASPVLVNVAANAGACLSRDGLEKLSSKASENFEVLSALRTRCDLPPATLTGIKQTVVERLTRDLAATHPDLGPREIEMLVEHNLAKVDLQAIDQPDRPWECLSQSGSVTERMLVDFARARRLPETVRCLALLTGLSDRIVAHCLFKAHLVALGVLCKANGFANPTYAALLHVRSAAGPLRGAMIAGAMRCYGMLELVRARGLRPTTASEQNVR